MKKSFKIIILILFIAFFCAGCDIINSGTTRDIRHSGFSLSNAEFECPSLLPSDDGYEKIKYLTGTTAITTDGSIYLLSFGQKYSNNLNCMKADFKPKVVSIFDNKVFKADDGNIYYLVSSGDAVAFSVVPESDSNYAIYKIILDDEEVLKATTVNQDSNSYYVLKKDGSIYNYIVPKDNGVSISSTSVVYSKNSYGGSIIDFNYVGKAPGTFIRTNNQIFRMLSINREECSKYVDIECKYEMMLDEGLTKHNDKILGFSGSFLITTYGKEFSASNA